MFVMTTKRAVLPLIIGAVLAVISEASAAEDRVVQVRHLQSISCLDPETGLGFSPLGVGFGPDGDLYVVDADNSRIMVLTEALDSMRVFWEWPEDLGACQLVDLLVDEAGQIVLSERAGGRVIRLDRNGGIAGEAVAGEGLAGIAMGRQGWVYATLTAAGMIVVLEPGDSTAYWFDFGLPGLDNPYPVDCAVTGSGRILVSESTTGGVVVLGPLGSDQGRLGDGTLESAFGVCQCYDDLTMVADSAAGRVIIFGPGGDILARFGEGLLVSPAFLACRPDGVVCVSDPGGLKIEVFSIETVAGN